MKKLLKELIKLNKIDKVSSLSSAMAHLESGKNIFCDSSVGYILSKGIEYGVQVDTEDDDVLKDFNSIGRLEAMVRNGYLYKI